jgi:hypothetical protein
MLRALPVLLKLQRYERHAAAMSVDQPERPGRRRCDADPFGRGKH